MLGIGSLRSPSIFWMDFFSDKADQIHRIYTAIKENAYPFNRVEVIDLPIAYSKYMDYYPGMLEFLRGYCISHRQ